MENNTTMKRCMRLMSSALMAVTLACVGPLLSSCSEDSPSDNALATVSLTVSAGNIGDLNGTRAGDDVNAAEHEFMNSLYVYIVDGGGNVVKAFVNPIQDYPAAATGDLTEWKSDRFPLVPETYTIYAFANIEGLSGDTDSQTKVECSSFVTDNFSEGNLVGADFTQLRLHDPAGMISLPASDDDNTKQYIYIPMSAQKSVTVTSSTTELSVGLDRLVGKVVLTLGDGSGLSEGGTVLFEGFSENVPLMSAASVDASYYGGRNMSQTFSLEDFKSGEVSFYVNETPDGYPFTITLNTGVTGGGVSVYEANTIRTSIPRNSIYPLTLTFSGYKPEITWRSWVSAIGNYPVEVNVEENNYIVKIAEGAQFEFTVNGVEGGTLTSAEWTAPDQTYMTDFAIAGNTISAALSGGVGLDREIPLTLKLTWTATVNSVKRTFTRTYNVIINTFDITDVVFKNVQAGSSMAVKSGNFYRLAGENLYIPLVTKKQDKQKPLY